MAILKNLLYCLQKGIQNFEKDHCCESDKPEITWTVPLRQKVIPRSVSSEGWVDLCNDSKIQAHQIQGTFSYHLY